MTGYRDVRATERCTKNVLGQKLRFGSATSALLVGLGMLSVGSGHAVSADNDKLNLMAGAGRIEITPPASSVKNGFIRDPLYVRAIYVANGDTCALLIGADQGGVSTQTVADAVGRLSSSMGCPQQNILISATHTHSGNSGVTSVSGGLGGDGLPTGKQVADAIVAAASVAKKEVRAARVTYGTTNVYLNVNRDLFANNRWNQGPNPEGTSDKTLAVVSFIDSDNKPIAVYMNYAMHPVNFYLAGLVSGDFAGAASRYIERRYDNKVVAVFTQGASGDQNPLLAFQRYRISGFRTGVGEVTSMNMGVPADEPWEMTANMTNSNKTMSDGLIAPVKDEAAYRAAVAESGEIVEAEGAIVGELALDTIRLHSPNPQSQAEIVGGQEDLSCPGRDRLDNSARQGALPPYKDGAPVVIKEGLLRIGDINFVSVNGEVYNGIAQRLKREVPGEKTMVVTLTNGRANSGYIYSNDAATHLTFQVIGSRLKPFCAENKIVQTAVDLFHTVKK